MRIFAPGDETGAFQNLQMLGDRRKTHLMRFGQLGHRYVTSGEAGKNFSPCRVGECGKRRAKRVGWHVIFNLLVDNHKVKYSGCVCQGHVAGTEFSQ